MTDSQPQQTGAAQQPQQAQQQQQQQQQPQQQQQQQLLRADDILRLQCLGDDEKQKHRVVMQNLWTMTQQHPQGSTEYLQARQKLTEHSTKLIARERQYRGRMRAQQQQQQLQNQGSSTQGNQGAQQNPPQSATQQEQPQAASNASAPQQPQGQQAQNPGQARPQAANAAPHVDPSIVKHVHDFPFALPPGGPALGTPEGDSKLKELKTMYLNFLAKSANFTTQMGKINTQIQERQRTGQDVPQELLAAKVRVEREYSQAKNQVDKFRTMQKSWKEEREQKEGQQQGQGQQTQPQSQPQPQPQQQQQPTPQQMPQQQQPTHQQPQRHPSQPGIQPQVQIKEEPQIKIEGGQAPQPQPTAQYNMPTNAQQQVQQPQQNMHPQAPAHSLAQQTQQQQQQPQQQQFPRQPPALHAQQMPPNQGQQFAPGQQQLPQHARPQINPHQVNAHPHQQNNSPHPQSATTAGPPVPLSHQAAVSAANRSYTDGGPRTNTPMGPGGQGSFHAPGSREREQLNNPKMPIPRHLNVASPMPVNMGQARPTMSGPTNGAPGPMGQPVIPRPPPFQLEGEGERVLSKRKLDELVRQVTGGREEALTPEVEEAVMQLADDFVDNVISSACKLSKLRESPQLDIRDMQLILERNYNIRIPGYASDEVRTVRKIVPATGWVEKMKAINAAKVMGGKTDF